MAIQALNEKNPAVVVRYRLTKPSYSVSLRYPGMFLPADQRFRFKAELGLKGWARTGSFISHFRIGNHPVPSPVFQIILTSSETDHIQDLEQLLGKPGQIVSLVLQAKFAPSGRAQQDDLTVSLEDWEAVDDFGDFSAEAEAEVPDEPISGQRFYEYTEMAHALLNDVVAGYTRLAFRERKKGNQDTEFLTELEVNKTLALTLLRQSKTFSSLDQLREVIDNYTPIVRALYNPSTSLAVS